MMIFLGEFFLLLFPVFKVDFNCGVYNVLTVTLTDLTETQADLTFTLIDLTITLADLSQIINFSLYMYLDTAVAFPSTAGTTMGPSDHTPGTFSKMF